MKKLQIAIDGPASAGKSTVAKLIAKKYNYLYLDTGAMYRVITLMALRNNLDLNNERIIMDKIVDHTDISFKVGEDDQLVFANNEDVTLAIRQENVTNNVSTIAALSSVRSALTEKMQLMAKNGGIVMDGRDIGTTVLPYADVKIFLVASVKERALRRFKENQQKGIDVSLETLEQEIETRDYKDSHRKVSPLTQAEDAQLIDTTSMTLEEVVNKISAIIDQINNK
ncbi:MAG: (d)CMP kinase [Firmicutes bacterium]|uniref:Cytidylate kinase n=1 Tax=Candidatus Gallilactobacillus intestinavium TaxID=2840838 RepID=A0A9D9E6M1_9LACO|nr:(d)CMP kinase [Candidatus Gallilactobacillus intestinavium]